MVVSTPTAQGVIISAQTAKVSTGVKFPNSLIGHWYIWHLACENGVIPVRMHLAAFGCVTATTLSKLFSFDKDA